ncbi:osmotically inducible protein C [Endozoicomonas sp. OPT23]|uniref:OsmC family protein n=1 Tax=Endozoicomonas sp. OPT23 TaxID=2072845 RepID=UPI00129AE934|nr:OsmC family protein [Endozoicomonas sp. OPT23]MRI31895.1 osmotically inducible protein C [Endozoicomonas sp. OPT23]
MAVNKTLSVTSRMTDSCRIEAQLGNHLAVIDQPKVAGGNDEGPTPLEFFLFSLGGCVASIARIVAKQQKITLRSIDVTVEAALNTAVLAGKTTDDRAGFQSFHVSASMDADLTTEEKKQFLDTVCARCPVHDNITKTSVVEHVLAEQVEPA